MFDLTHEENIKKTKKAITQIADILKLRNILKYSIERPQGSAIMDLQVLKSYPINSGNHAELLQHRVEGGDRNVKQHLPIAP